MIYKDFADALAESLRRHYGGRIPSFSTIARDFALYSPAGLAPISVETPRKWIRGESLPSLERLQTLAHWLGPEILEPLNGGFLKKTSQALNGSHNSTDQLANVTELLEQLSNDELDSIEQLLNHLVKAHVKHRGNGKA